MADGIQEAARAKINLALHVTGRRADGYHLLDSLVTFVDCSDDLVFSPAATDRLAITGPFGPDLKADAGNLVIRARDLLRRAAEAQGIAAPPVDILLVKNLPIASGIGGGSADAAATLRGLMRLWAFSPPEAELAEMALSLGADLPMCLAGRPLLARGIGEAITPVAMPSLGLVLLNPLVGVSTPDIFRSLTRRDNPPLPPLPETQAPQAWLDYLRRQRNDLEAPARSLVPEIDSLLEALVESGAQVARMSGSGASCFGLYESGDAARAAAGRISAQLAAGPRKTYIRATQTLA
ncbi:4-(cytidine 5'-diphospho)-2-C-methyl-D-erythritol kinase [Rhizobium sp. SSA_523]|uniref:4-(cytidine 5'-diphospho)-2-C-methyl-D-erythritol kinase n=1 Tax=Rhizobium sp. SSA_523 TaxID=2952477 RepID=UPI00209048C0|nr:4-(cytidine 5'-diphospho)-2-C-methyl-D-erythritol kinase [Rhizobium sp. SSA_523]MCO5731113.1 4-(cytidine 5'-diphospho)-2-C-methyl-D-erythritol kinase [Rhizobium sp. SSA_523]WKC24090.1 4-(cytidine 5'-diphospho)-2-C-methyl-D-erythritol kinase [Rhizobium sp. SSA_523]